MEIIVDASELKDEGKEVIQALADFMKEKTAAEVTKESNKITIKTETLPKKHLRLLVKKYLHKTELKEYYRVISENEDTLTVKQRKIEED
jgi:hypothetical protein